MEEIVCLSVRNPLSYLICEGIKDVENRTWKTDYRGRLFIHSSGSNEISFGEDDLPEGVWNDPEHEGQIEALILKIGDFYDAKGIDLEKTVKEKDAYFKGHAIIGYVDLVDIVRDSKSKFAIPGQYHWIVKNPVLLDKPLTNVAGKLSLWRYQYDGVL
jgi:hypothetical protein